MKFGTSGAGTVAFAFAREALAAGHEVIISSRRGPESLAGMPPYCRVYGEQLSALCDFGSGSRVPRAHCFDYAAE
jgi:predicted dinucleotide-binding enzyme